MNQPCRHRHRHRHATATPPATVMHHVFVYGTLKQGFSNFHVNGGQRVPGRFVTVQRLPLYIVGAELVPWLVDDPGRGEHVIGEVYAVDDRVLADMDELEQVDEAGWYTRRTIAVRPLEAPATAPMTVFVYFGDPQRVAREGAHAGPLAEFSAEQDRRYRGG